MSLSVNNKYLENFIAWTMLLLGVLCSGLSIIVTLYDINYSYINLFLAFTIIFYTFIRLFYVNEEKTSKIFLVLNMIPGFILLFYNFFQWTEVTNLIKLLGAWALIKAVLYVVLSKKTQESYRIMKIVALTLFGTIFLAVAYDPSIEQPSDTFNLYQILFSTMGFILCLTATLKVEEIINNLPVKCLVYFFTLVSIILLFFNSLLYIYINTYEYIYHLFMIFLDLATK